MSEDPQLPLFQRLKLCCHSRFSITVPLPPRRKPCKSYRISGSSQLIFPKDQAVTRTGMLTLTPLPLYQSKLNFPYSALGETISGCGRRVEHIAGCWETLGNKPCVLTKGLAYAKHFSYTSIASMLPCLYQNSLLGGELPKQDKSYTTKCNTAIVPIQPGLYSYACQPFGTQPPNQ